MPAFETWMSTPPKFSTAASTRRWPSSDRRHRLRPARRCRRRPLSRRASPPRGVTAKAGIGVAIWLIDDARALAREGDRGRSADAARAAGDDRNLALEQHRLPLGLRDQRREAAAARKSALRMSSSWPANRSPPGEQRKAIASAGSRGLLSFSRGSFATGPIPEARIVACMSVSTTPGAKPKTLMPLSGIFGSERPGQHGKAGLRRAIGAPAGDAAMCAAPDEMLTIVPRPAAIMPGRTAWAAAAAPDQIDAETFAAHSSGLGLVQGADRRDDAGIVDEDRDGAEPRSRRDRNRRLDRADIAHVAGKRDRPAAAADNFGGDRIGIDALSRGDDDGRACRAQARAPSPRRSRARHP